MTPSHGRYILNADGEPVPCDDLKTWARWFSAADRTLCASNDEAPDAPEIRISTVFLALDHSFGNGPLILWETMVFGGPLDGEMARYSSKADAIAGHQAICARVAAALHPPPA